MEYLSQLSSLQAKVEDVRTKGSQCVSDCLACCVVSNCTPNNATLMITQAIRGWDQASFFKSVAIGLQGKVKTLQNAIEAIVYLDQARDLLVSRGVKDSSEARKRIVDQHEDVVSVGDLKSSVDALVCFFTDKQWEFKMAYDALKKVGMNDPSVGDNNFGN